MDCTSDYSSDPFLRYFRPHHLLQDAHDKMLQTLCGIFDTNCFELCPSGAGDTISGVFPAAAMMMHRLGMMMMVMMVMMMMMRCSAATRTPDSPSPTTT